MNPHLTLFGGDGAVSGAQQGAEAVKQGRFGYYSNRGVRHHDNQGCNSEENEDETR